MNDYCVDEYERWTNLNDELELWEDWDEMYKEEWEGNYDQMIKDIGNGNYSDALEHAYASREAFFNHVKAGWAADRLRNGDWEGAAGDLDDCINQHDWQEP